MKCPRRPKPPGKKSGPKKDKLPKGYKLRENAVVGEMGSQVFIGKVK
jgi:hypothetical protein